MAAMLGSRHKHSLQYLVLTPSPQQSPPSHSHPQLLFSSSHQLSPLKQNILVITLLPFQIKVLGGFHILRKHIFGVS